MVPARDADPVPSSGWPVALLKSLLFLALAVGSQWALARYAERGNAALKALLGEYGYSLYVWPVLQCLILVLLTWAFLALVEKRNFFDVGFRVEQRHQFWKGALAGFLPGIALALPLVVTKLVEPTSSPSMVIRGSLLVPIYALSWVLVDGGYALQTLSRRFGAPAAIAVVAVCSNLLPVFSRPKDWSSEEFAISLIHGVLGTAVVGLAAARGRNAWLPSGLALGVMLGSSSGVTYLSWSSSVMDVLRSYTVWSFWGGVPRISALLACAVLVLLMRLPDRRPRLSLFYPASWAVSVGLAALIVVRWFWKLTVDPGSPDNELLGAASLLMLYGGVVFYILLYKAWAAIQDGHARTTPRRAIGFFFIPLFNIYWVFQVLPGFATDYNRHLERHQIVDAPRLNRGIFTAYLLLSIVSVVPFVGFVTMAVAYCLGIVMMVRMCGAVNALAYGSAAKGAVPLIARSLTGVGAAVIGRRIAIPPEGIVVGSNPTKGFGTLNVPFVGDKHARLGPDSGGVGIFLEDLNSGQGTWYAIGDEWVRVSAPLSVPLGARVRFGSSEAEFRVESDPTRPATAQPLSRPATAEQAAQSSAVAVQTEERPSRDQRGLFMTMWRKGATSFRVDLNGKLHELQIVRTSLGAFTVYLDHVPLDVELKVPRIFISAQEVPLPDGSVIRVSAWGVFGWSLKRNGVRLRAVSHKPVLVQTLLVLLFASIVGLGTGYSIWWFQRPEWKKADPPVWSFFASSSGDSGKSRWFINTRAIRRNGPNRSVKVLMRHQTVAVGESDGADIPKDDEYTSVQNFTCDPNKQGYDLSANLKGFSGKEIPDTLPPDSELPRALAWRDFSQIRPGSIIAEAREAACFLAGYR